ncbi:unnamed protein product, partial [Symbiodinium sp. CCMP2456]
MGIGLAARLAQYCTECVRDIGIGHIANVSSLVWLPVYGYINGSQWLRQIATQVTLTSRGDQASECTALVPFYWILVLPTSMIASLVQGLRTDISALPMSQANPCVTLATALAKALHWVRQGHIDANATNGAGIGNDWNEQAIAPPQLRPHSQAQVRLTLPHGIEAIVTR